MVDQDDFNEQLERLAAEIQASTLQIEQTKDDILKKRKERKRLDQEIRAAVLAKHDLQEEIIEKKKLLMSLKNKAKCQNDKAIGVLGRSRVVRIEESDGDIEETIEAVIETMTATTNDLEATVRSVDDSAGKKRKFDPQLIETETATKAKLSRSIPSNENFGKARKDGDADEDLQSPKSTIIPSLRRKSAMILNPRSVADNNVSKVGDDENKEESEKEPEDIQVDGPDNLGTKAATRTKIKSELNVERLREQNRLRQRLYAEKIRKYCFACTIHPCSLTKHPFADPGGLRRHLQKKVRSCLSIF